MKEHTFTCCHCGHPHSLSERILVDDDELCEACADEETVICAHCGERIYRDDNAGDDNTPLCQSCYDRHYTSCEHCGRIIHQYDAYYEDGDEDTPICYDCHTRVSRKRPSTIITTSLLRCFAAMALGTSAWSWKSIPAARMMTMRSRSCERPERPVTLRPFKVMRFEYKKAPHSNRVRCLELVG